jgi:hypothetical protein
MSTREQRAIAAYERHCRENHIVPDHEPRQQWIKDWRQLDEEARQAAVDAQREGTTAMSGRLDQAWKDAARNIERDAGADAVKGVVNAEIDAARKQDVNIDTQPDQEIG